MATINIQPSVLDLALYAGDGVEFRLICTDSGDDPVDITGGVEAQIRPDRTDDADPVAEFSCDLINSVDGIIVLSLTGDQTKALVDGTGKFTGVWDVEWTPAGLQPRTLCQGNVECVADVTR